MTNLTDKWRKGELPYAEYYIKLAGGEYTNDVWDIDGWQSFNKKGDVVVEVLAPVPSYEQWQDLKSKIQLKETAYDFDTARLEEENTKLKELLKQARGLMNCTKDWACTEATEEMISKISEVLGEE